MAETVKNDVDPESKFKKFMGILFDKPIPDDDGNQIGVQRGLLTGIGRGLVGYSQGLKGNVVDYSNEDAEINLAYQKLAQERKDKAMEQDYQKAMTDYIRGITPGGALPGNPIAQTAPVPGTVVPQASGGISLRGNNPMANFIQNFPQGQLSVTGANSSGLTFGQNPAIKAAQDIYTDVAKTGATKEAEIDFKRKALTGDLATFFQLDDFVQRGEGFAGRVDAGLKNVLSRYDQSDIKGSALQARKDVINRLRPTLARAAGDVGNLNIFEQQAAASIVPSEFDSAKTAELKKAFLQEISSPIAEQDGSKVKAVIEKYMKSEAYKGPSQDEIKKMLDGVQFDIDGRKYYIPKDKVEAFKKAKGIK